MNERVNQTGRRVFLVTGAAGEIGSAICRRLAERPEHEVVLAGRGETRLEQLAEEIMRSTGNPHVRYETADLSRKTEIEALAARWQGPLHVLVNNAAITPRQRLETPEGIELQFATNVLGYFWMTKAFEEILKQAGHSSTPKDAPRVVNVASYWSGDLDMSDLEFKHRSYHNGIAYRQ
ncbi:MAG: SDR family NAD(P)-dependent oxidoreductase, partial [Anaerolineaceae bacterium]